MTADEFQRKTGSKMVDHWSIRNGYPGQCHYLYEHTRAGVSRWHGLCAILFWATNSHDYYMRNVYSHLPPAKIFTAYEYLETALTNTPGY